jgi:hypothetical protein
LFFLRKIVKLTQELQITKLNLKNIREKYALEQEKVKLLQNKLDENNMEFIQFNKKIENLEKKENEFLLLQKTLANNIKENFQNSSTQTSQVNSTNMNLPVEDESNVSTTLFFLFFLWFGRRTGRTKSIFLLVPNETAGISPLKYTVFRLFKAT